VYILRSCILIPQNCIRKKLPNVRHTWYIQLLLTMFLSSDVPFLHSKSFNALYMLRVYIAYTTHIMLCYLFFYNILRKTKILNSLKKSMLHHDKLKTLQPISCSLWYICKILQDINTFDKKCCFGISSAPLINMIINMILNEFVLNCALIKRFNGKINNKKSPWCTIHSFCLLLVSKKYLNKPRC